MVNFINVYFDCFYLKFVWCMHTLFTFSVYFPLRLHWKSATFNFLRIHLAYSCAMCTNTNVITSLEYKLT